MTSHPDKHLGDEHLAPHDRAFVDQLARHFRPPPLSPNQRAAFDIGLEARLAKRRRRVFVPAFATLAAATAVLMLTLTGRFSPPPTDAPTGNHSQIATTTVAPEPATTEEIDQWAYDLLAFSEPMTYQEDGYGSDEFDDPSAYDQAADSGLPDEYLAIESMFLEG